MYTNYNIFENEIAFLLYQELVSIPGISLTSFDEEVITVDAVRYSLDYAHMVLHNVPPIEH